MNQFRERWLAASWPMYVVSSQDRILEGATRVRESPQICKIVGGGFLWVSRDEDSCHCGKELSPNTKLQCSCLVWQHEPRPVPCRTWGLPAICDTRRTQVLLVSQIATPV